MYIDYVQCIAILISQVLWSTPLYTLHYYDENYLDFMEFLKATQWLWDVLRLHIGKPWQMFFETSLEATVTITLQGNAGEKVSYVGNTDLKGDTIQLEKKCILFVQGRAHEASWLSGYLWADTEV